MTQSFLPLNSREKPTEMSKNGIASSLVLALMIVLYSCVPQKQVSSSKTQLSTINTKLQEDQDLLNKLDAARANKETQNGIDDTANARLRQYINATKEEIDTLIKGNSIFIGESVVDKNDWERLKSALSRIKSSSKKINDKVQFLGDLINRNLVIKLDQDVIFEPGEYRVSGSVAENITKQFEPAVKEIDLFTKKYPDFPLSLVITAKGYADGSIISPSTQLYRDLKQRLNLSNVEPDNRELNKELSRARAEAVKLLFQKFASTRTDTKIFNSKVLYLYEGKGELYPDPLVSDYRSKDPRRRVVLLYWSVFPE